MKYSAISYTLSLVLLGLVSQSAQGFQTITSPSSLSASSLSQNHLATTDPKVSKIALYASLIDPEQEPEKSRAAASEENPAWKKVVEINNKFWDYTVNFFYVFMTCGILLNLSGYAYQVDLENGFTIQTVQERRQELQWEKEMQRYDQEVAIKQKTLLEKIQ